MDGYQGHRKKEKKRKENQMLVRLGRETTILRGHEQLASVEKKMKAKKKKLSLKTSSVPATRLGTNEIEICLTHNHQIGNVPSHRKPRPVR